MAREATSRAEYSKGTAPPLTRVGSARNTPVPGYHWNSGNPVGASVLLSRGAGVPCTRADAQGRYAPRPGPRCRVAAMSRAPASRPNVVRMRLGMLGRGMGSLFPPWSPRCWYDGHHRDKQRGKADMTADDQERGREGGPGRMRQGQHAGPHPLEEGAPHDAPAEREQPRTPRQPTPELKMA